MAYIHGDEASCFGKKQYRTYWSAARSARHLNRYNEGSKGNPYRCFDCRFWHTGNTMGKKKKRRPSRHTAKGRMRRGGVKISR